MKKKHLKITGVIGDPIAHSLSPAMQNAAFRKSRLGYLYFPLHVRPKELGRFLARMRKWDGLAGFNVTIPHKEAVIKHLDRLSPEARAIGAVNTVVVRKGRLFGYNTDAPGYLRSLKTETGFRPRGKRILILGAGGAARALVFALARAGAREIVVYDMIPGKAERLVKEYRKRFRQVRIGRIEMNDTDLLINATPVGLKGTRFKDLPLNRLPQKAIVSDLVYHPAMTPLLQEALRRRLRIHSGLGMLLQQGALSFKLWTGKMPPLNVMKKALLDALRGNK